MESSRRGTTIYNTERENPILIARVVEGWIKSFTPFALLPSLLSLIIVHLPPTTLSCDVLSLSVSLPPTPSPSLSLTPPPSRTYNTQHSHSLFLFFCLDFRLHTLFPFPVSLSFSLSIYIFLSFERVRSSPVGKDKRTSRKGKEESLEAGLGLDRGKRKKRNERESNRALTVWDYRGC